MTPLMPKYMVWVVCFTPAGSDTWIIAEDVFLHEAWLAIQQFIQPDSLHLPPYLSPVVNVDFIIGEDDPLA
jgi:hypothetical protein